jgi:hypothetical protein
MGMQNVSKELSSITSTVQRAAGAEYRRGLCRHEPARRPAPLRGSGVPAGGRVSSAPCVGAFPAVEVHVGGPLISPGTT